MMFCALVNEMMREGDYHSATFTLLGFSTYLRPSQLLKLTGAFMIRPGGGMKYWSLLVNPMESSQVSKTGENEQTLKPHQAWVLTTHLLCDRPHFKPIGFDWPPLA